MSWDNEKKNHSLEQLKYLLNDWLKTNSPDLNVNQEIFNATCNCILEKVVIPNYEYKDGIEYIQWTSEDNEKIMYCIQNIIGEKGSLPSINSGVDLFPADAAQKNSDKVNETKPNYSFYIIISILILIIIGFCIYIYFRDIKDNDLSLDIDIE